MGFGVGRIKAVLAKKILLNKRRIYENNPDSKWSVIDEKIPGQIEFELMKSNCCINKKMDR